MKKKIHNTSVVSSSIQIDRKSSKEKKSAHRGGSKHSLQSIVQNRGKMARVMKKKRKTKRSCGS